MPQLNVVSSTVVGIGEVLMIAGMLLFAFGRFTGRRTNHSWQKVVGYLGGAITLFGYIVSTAAMLVAGGTAQTIGIGMAVALVVGLVWWAVQTVRAQGNNPMRPVEFNSYELVNIDQHGQLRYITRVDGDGPDNLEKIRQRLEATGAESLNLRVRDGRCYLSCSFKTRTQFDSIRRYLEGNWGLKLVE